MADEKRWHRIKFYQGCWSHFDAIELCKAPGACPLCDTQHPFCTERGAVLEDDKWQD